MRLPFRSLEPKRWFTDLYRAGREFILCRLIDRRIEYVALNGILSSFTSAYMIRMEISPFHRQATVP